MVITLFILSILCGFVCGEKVTDNDAVLRRFELLEQRVNEQNEVITKLQQVVNRQSDTIKHQAELTQKQAKEIEELKRVIELRSHEIDSTKPKRFVMNDGDSIAFHARIDQSEIAHISIAQKLIFDITVLNNGNSYHNSTGVFVAPAAGLYFFSLSVCILHPGNDIHAEIVKNGISIAGSLANGYDQGSVSTVIPLDVNDEVWVTSLHHPDTYLWGDTLTSFMGFKILDY